MTPGRYRKDTTSIPLYEKVNIYQKTLMNIEKWIEPQIVLEKAFQLVGLEQTVKPGEDKIQKLWNELHDRKDEIADIVNPQYRIGVCEYMPNITDESEFKYMAGYEVKLSEHIAGGMQIKSIPCSKYAIFRHQGSISTLRETYSKIYGVWLLLSECELEENDIIEVYQDGNQGECTLDIYIPLKV